MNNGPSWLDPNETEAEGPKFQLNLQTDKTRQTRRTIRVTDGTEQTKPKEPTE